MGEAVQHIKVTDPAFREGQHLAVELAQAHPFIYHLDGVRTKARRLCLEQLPGSASLNPRQLLPLGHLAARLGAAGDSDAAAWDGLCVSKAFRLLGWDLCFGPDSGLS